MKRGLCEQNDLRPWPNVDEYRCKPVKVVTFKLALFNLHFVWPPMKNLHEFIYLFFFFGGGGCSLLNDLGFVINVSVMAPV